MMSQRSQIQEGGVNRQKDLFRDPYYSDPDLYICNIPNLRSNG